MLLKDSARACAAAPDPLCPSVRMSDGGFHLGRAGMRYRDLIPGRQGRTLHRLDRFPSGRCPVHFHKVVQDDLLPPRQFASGLMLIRPPFVLHAGDCVPAAHSPPVLRLRQPVELLRTRPGADRPGCCPPPPSSQRDFSEASGFVHHKSDGGLAVVPAPHHLPRLRHAAATAGLAAAGVARLQPSTPSTTPGLSSGTR